MTIRHILCRMIEEFWTEFVWALKIYGAVMLASAVLFVLCTLAWRMLP